MKKHFLVLAASLCLSASAFATIDTFIEVKVPVANMQEEGYFFANTLAWDGVSSGMTHVPLTLQTLQAPLRVQGILASEDKDGWVANVNALHDSGVAVSDITDSAEEMHMDIIRVEIDGTEASKNGPALEADQKMKLAIYSVVFNLAGYTKRLVITLKGIPTYQLGTKNQLPKQFKYPFTMNSPFIAAIKKELSI